MSKLLSLRQQVFMALGLMFGAGVVEIPKSFEQAGVIGGGLLLLTGCFLVVITTFYLEASARKEEEKKAANGQLVEPVTYGDLLKSNSANFLSYLPSFFIVLICYSSCLSYFLLLNNYLIAILKNVIPVGALLTYNLLIRFLCALFFSFSLGIATIKINDFKKLDKLGFVSFLMVVMSAIYLFAFSLRFQNINDLDFKFGRGEYMAPISNIIYSLCCQQATLQITNSLKKRSKTNTILTFLIASLIASVLYYIIGYSGFSLIGKFGNENFISILLNRNGKFFNELTLNDQNTVYFSFLSLTFVFIVGLCSSFISQNLLGRKCLSELTKDTFSEGKLDALKGAAIQFLIFTALATFNWSPSLTISLIGSLLMPFICIIGPAFVYSKYVFLESRQIKRLVLPILIFLSGIFILCVSTKNSIEYYITNQALSLNQTEFFDNQTAISD